jgi:RNA polymerase sigma-70 factor, ECF subfamily
MVVRAGTVFGSHRDLCLSKFAVTGVPVKPQVETDRQLVERVKRGDKRAFDMLVLKYQYRITGLISRYLRNQDEVADVAQEAFIKAYRALPRFRGDSAFYTWLYRIAINTAKNHLVSKSRRPPDSDVDISLKGYREPGEPPGN